MVTRTRTVVLATLCALGAGFAADRADAARRTRTRRAKLLADAALGAKGTITILDRAATRRSQAREQCVLRLAHLDPAATYSLWIDDPFDDDGSLVRVPPFEVRAGRKRKVTVRFDSAGPDGLPFSATLAELGSLRVQVRDETGTVVLLGVVPAFPPPK